jgi:hypothetical protein
MSLAGYGAGAAGPAIQMPRRSCGTYSPHTALAPTRAQLAAGERVEGKEEERRGADVWVPSICNIHLQQTTHQNSRIAKYEW